MDGLHSGLVSLASTTKYDLFLHCLTDVNGAKTSKNNLNTVPFQSD